MHITQLDVAYDDHTGILDIDRISEDLQKGYFISPMRYRTITRSYTGEDTTGISCQVGSFASKTLIRIYDKALERGISDGQHWVRVELQLRDSRAEEFLRVPLEVGEAFAGVILNYLRFVVPENGDSNKSRWKTADYWSAFIGDVGRIHIFTAPGSEYNEKKCRHYVCDMAGNAIDAMLKMHGVSGFLNMIYTRSCAPNPKYALIVDEHWAKEEAWRQKVRQYMDVDADAAEPPEAPVKYAIMNEVTGEVLDYLP